MSKLRALIASPRHVRAQARRVRKPRADSAQTRRAILEATLRILRDHGLAELTHRAVAQEAGVSLALTSYHFASKDNLISEALDLAASETLRWLEQTAVELTANGGGALIPDLVAERLGDLTMGRLGDEQLAVVSGGGAVTRRRPPACPADSDRGLERRLPHHRGRPPETLRHTRSEGRRGARGRDARGPRVPADRRVEPQLRARGAPALRCGGCSGRSTSAASPRPGSIERSGARGRAYQASHRPANCAACAFVLCPACFMIGGTSGSATKLCQPCSSQSKITQTRSSSAGS